MPNARVWGTGGTRGGHRRPARGPAVSGGIGPAVPRAETPKFGRGGSGPVDAPTRECPSCGLTVRERVDGALRGHRIKDGTGSWPCPGENAAPKGEAV